MKKIPYCTFGSGVYGVVMDTPNQRSMRDKDGKLLIERAILAITDLSDVQSDPGRAPVEIATISIKRQQDDGSMQDYTAKVASERLETPAGFEQVMAEILPGVKFDNKHGRLLAAMLLCGSADQQHRMPTMSTETWMTDAGWYFNGTRLSDAPIEIVSKREDKQSGQTLYTIRTPRRDGSGYDYATTDWEGLNSGTYRYRFGRQFNTFDSLHLSMAMRARFKALSDVDRERLRQEQYSQEKQELEAALSRRFRVPGGR